MVRPTPLSDTIKKKLRSFYERGETLRGNKTAIIKAVGGKKEFEKCKVSIVDFLKNSKKALKKNKAKITFSSKRGPKSFLLTLEDKKITEFIMSNDEAVAKYSAPCDFPTEQADVNEAQQVLPFMLLRTAMESQSPDFQSFTWQEVVKAANGHDPYWFLMKIQVIKEHDKYVAEEEALFGSHKYVKASQDGLFKLTQRYTAGIWLPLDAPHLFRNGGWIRDQMLAYSEQCNHQPKGMKQETFFKLLHLYLRGSTSFNNFKEIIAFYKGKESTLNKDFTSSQSDAQLVREQDDAIEEQLAKAEQERLKKVEADLRANIELETQIEAYDEFEEQIDHYIEEVDTLKFEAARRQQIYRRNVQRLEKLNRNYSSRLNQYIVENRGLRNNLVDLIPVMWQRPGVADWYDSDISSQCGIDPMDYTGQEQMPETLAHCDDFPEEEEKVAQQPPLQAPPLLENVFRSGPGSSRSTPPALSGQTLDYLRRNANNLGLPITFPPTSSLTPLQVQIIADGDEYSATYEQFLIQSWNLKDVDQLIVLDEEEEQQQANDIEMIPKRNDKQE